MFRSFIKFAELFVWITTIGEFLWRFKSRMGKMIRSCMTCLVLVAVVALVAVGLVLWQTGAIGATFL